MSGHETIARGVDDKALHERLLRARRSLPTDEPLRQTFRARHRALLASERVAEARRIEAGWIERCTAYRDAVAAGVPGDVDTVDTHGLRLALPRATSATGFGTRLREGWLPWRDILGQRELGLGGVMIDIGANIGTTSLVRVIAGDVQRVYALEPEPANFACLVQNIAANGLQGFVLPGRLRHLEPDRRGAPAPGQRVGRAPAARRQGAAARPSRQRQGRDLDARRLGARPRRGRERSVTGEGRYAGVGIARAGGAAGLLACHHIAWVLEVSPRHLEAAGTPLTRLIEQCQAHFTHAIDLRAEYAKARVVPVSQLPEALAYLESAEAALVHQPGAVPRVDGRAGSSPAGARATSCS